MGIYAYVYALLMFMRYVATSWPRNAIQFVCFNIHTRLLCFVKNQNEKKTKTIEEKDTGNVVNARRKGHWRIE